MRLRSNSQRKLHMGVSAVMLSILTHTATAADAVIDIGTVPNIAPGAVGSKSISIFDDTTGDVFGSPGIFYGGARIGAATTGSYIYDINFNVAQRSMFDAFLSGAYGPNQLTSASVLRGTTTIATGTKLVGFADSYGIAPTLLQPMTTYTLEIGGSFSPTFFPGLAGAGGLISVRPAPVTPQIVYLDFGLDPNAAFSAVDKNGRPYTDSFSKVDAKFSPSIVGQITSGVQSILSDYLIDVVTTRPNLAQSKYDTLYIGGTLADLTTQLRTDLVNTKSDIATANAFALTGVPDQNNDLPTGLKGVVFSENPDFNSCGGNPCSENIPLLSQVISHEIGHMMGLHHNNLRDSELMWPYTKVDATNITGTSRAALSCFVGLRATGQRQCDGLTLFFRKFGVEFSQSLYDVLLYIESQDGSDELGSIIDLGDLGPGPIDIFDLPLQIGDRVHLVGAFSDGGPIELLGTLTIPNQDPTVPILLQTVGHDTSIPEPGSLMTIVLGLGILLCIQKRKAF